jgi:hypothetical protein
MFSKFITYLKPVSLSSYREEEGIVGAIRTVVGCYFAVLPFLALHFLNNGLEKKPNLDVIWPISWTEALSLSDVGSVVVVKMLFVIVSLVVAFTYKYRFARVLLFIAIWQVHALESSYGHINHQWYTWLYTAGIFIFLPDIWKKNTSFGVIHQSLLVVWGAQAFIMLTYTMAGINKFYHVFYQYSLGEIHGFSKEAMLYQSTWWVPQLQQPAYAIDWIITFPIIAWIAYISLHFIQFFALWTMLRVSLQRVWTFLLLSFHIGTFLIMGIIFPQHVLLLCVLFVLSPFAVRHYSLKTQLFDLPVIGQLSEIIFKTWSKRNS